MYTKTAVALALVGYASAFTGPAPLALRKPAGAMTMSAQSNAAKAAIAGAVLISAAPAFAGDAGAGEKVFNANCAVCHAGGQNSVVADHTLEKAAIEKFLTGGFKESSVVTQVRCAPSADPVPIELRRSPA